MILGVVMVICGAALWLVLPGWDIAYVTAGVLLGAGGAIAARER